MPMALPGANWMILRHSQFSGSNSGASARGDSPSSGDVVCIRQPKMLEDEVVLEDSVVPSVFDDLVQISEAAVANLPHVSCRSKAIVPSEVHVLLGTSNANQRLHDRIAMDPRSGLSSEFRDAHGY